MKAEITFPPELVDEIAEKVAEKLQPLLLSEYNCTSFSEEKYLTVKKLSDYIGLSKSWVYNNMNKIPHHTSKGEKSKRGKPLFKKSEIDNWLKTQWQDQKIAYGGRKEFGHFREQGNEPTTSVQGKFSKK